MSAALKIVMVTLFAAILGGCGTYVPKIQEVGDDRQGRLLVQAIIGSIHCELRNAVTQIYWDDVAASPANGRRFTEFFDKWGAQVQLQLAVQEKTDINPALTWIPNSIFSLGAAANLSSEATRTDKINYFFKVSDLRSLGGCVAGAPTDPHPPGSLLLQANLETYDWLSGLMMGAVTGDITMIAKENALTHEVKFEVVSTGSLSPAWKLSRVFSVNPSGSLFSATRNRTHDLLITFGPIDETKSQTLAPTAQNSFLASQINLSASGFRILLP